MPDPHLTDIEQSQLTASPLGALTDLDVLVAEVGHSHPLHAYPAGADPADERGSFDAMILAGLVKP